MEPLVHYIIPTLFILALNPKIDRRRVLRYSPLAVLPDIDFFFGHAILHNIFAAFALSLVVYYIAKKDRTAFLLAAYFLYSHLILDLGFVALLYPLKHSVLSLNLKVYTSPMVKQNILNILTGRGNIMEQVGNLTKIAPNMITERPLDAARTAKVSPIFTQTGLMLSLVLLLAAGFGRASKK